MSGVSYKHAENQIIRSVLVESTVSANDRILYQEIRFSLTTIAMLEQVTCSLALS